VMPGIRTSLMDSADHNCPSCETPGQSPDVLIPNKYLRGMVTSFINETSYVSTKKAPVSGTTSSSSASTFPAAAPSAARTVVVKSDPLATDLGGQPTELPSHLMGMPPQVLRVAQVKQPLLELPPRQLAAGTQLSMPGGPQSAVRTTAAEHYGHHLSRSMGFGMAAAHQASPSRTSSHLASDYTQSAVLAAPGSAVSQSQSAPSLLSHNQLE